MSENLIWGCKLGATRDHVTHPLVESNAGHTQFPFFSLGVSLPAVGSFVHAARRYYHRGNNKRFPSQSIGDTNNVLMILDQPQQQAHHTFRSFGLFRSGVPEDIGRTT